MQLLHSLTSLLFIAATVSGAALPSAEPEAAPVAVAVPSTLEARQGLDLTWACSVPSNYVYDTVRSVLSTCGSGFQPQYRLRWPANNVWSCIANVNNLTWDLVQSNLNQCSSSGFAFSYRLKTPTNNLFSCKASVPGYTWDLVQNNLNQCSASGFAFAYRLKAPVSGLWACSVPSGWTYSASQNNLNVCSASGFAYSYRLA